MKIDISGLFMATSKQEAMDMIVEDFKVRAVTDQHGCLNDNVWSSK